jgi:hypothetical protein
VPRAKAAYGARGRPAANSLIPALLAARVLVRPLHLHCVIPQFLSLLAADIANLAVKVVVPSVAGYRIGDRLASTPSPAMDTG